MSSLLAQAIGLALGIQRDIIFTRETKQWILNNYEVKADVYLVEASEPSSLFYLVKPAEEAQQLGENGHLSHFFSSLPETLEKEVEETKLSSLILCADNQEQARFITEDITLLPLVKSGVCVAVLALSLLDEDSLDNVKRILDIIAKSISDVSVLFGMLLSTHSFRRRKFG